MKTYIELFKRDGIREQQIQILKQVCYLLAQLTPNDSNSLYLDTNGIVIDSMITVELRKVMNLLIYMIQEQKIHDVKFTEDIPEYLKIIPEYSGISNRFKYSFINKDYDEEYRLDWRYQYIKYRKI